MFAQGPISHYIPAPEKDSISCASHIEITQKP
jgi:hypothetical protein